MSLFGKIKKWFCKCPDHNWIWHDYIRFPSDHTNMIAIVLSSGKIVRIWDDKNTIEIEENNGGYLNEIIHTVKL